MRSLLITLSLLVAAPAVAQEIASVMERTVVMVEKGGVFEANPREVLGDATVESMRLVADWWKGPSDDRAGDGSRSRGEGFRFAVLLDRKWRDLPVVDRDLRLEGRIEVPGELVKDRKAKGPWRFRQIDDGERALRMVLHLRYRAVWGKTHARPDLLFRWFVPSGREAPAGDGTVSLHDRAPVLRVKPGDEVTGEVEILNAGYGDARKAGWTVTLRPWTRPGRGGKRLLADEIGHLRESGDLGRNVGLKIPPRTRPGEYALVFELDPAGRIGELVEDNNALAFPLIVVADDDR